MECATYMSEKIQQSFIAKICQICSGQKSAKRQELSLAAGNYTVLMVMLTVILCA
jgi:hypothetical protein